jgi:hypothetical protein
MISLRFLAVAGCVAVAGCGSVPNDVNTGALNGQISTPDVIGPTAAPGGIPTAAGATGDVTFLDPDDLAARAEGAISAAEGGPAAGGVFENIQPQQASDVLPPPLIPRVAAFAIRTTHGVGQQQYRRNPFRRDGQSLCSQFPTRDQAQDRFLSDGGPERDPNGMDPDGDGFVCGFDPTELRASANAPVETFDNPLPIIDG